MSGSDNLLFKNSLIYAMGDIIPKVLNLITFPILTQHLASSEFGVVNYVNSVELFLSIITLLGLNTYYLVHYYKVTDERQKRDLLGNLSIFLLIVNVLFTIISFIAGQRLFSAIGSEISFFPFIAMGVMSNFFGLFSILPSALFRLKENPLPLTVINVVKGAAIMFATCIVVVKHPSAATVLGIKVFVTFLFSIVFIVITVKNCNFTINWNQIKQALLFSLPLVPGSLAYYFSSMSDRILIEKYLSTTELGIYSAATTIGLILNIVSNGAYRSFEPHFFKTYGQQAFVEDFIKIRNTLLFAILIAGFCLSVYAREFYMIFSNEEYYSAYRYVPFIVWGVTFSSMSLMYSTVLTAQKKTKTNAMVSIIVAACSLCLNMLLLPRFGIIAAACINAMVFFFSYILEKSFSKLRNVQIARPVLAMLTSAILMVLLIRYVVYDNIWVSITVKTIFAIVLLFINSVLLKVNIFSLIRGLFTK
ncbi:MAG: oligosaccharide flippase family protein [Bacteroidaceae bacterium]|nr:oligosaccharide flippase family protein [Bacteroidaceae bacterium]